MNIDVRIIVTIVRMMLIPNDKKIVFLLNTSTVCKRKYENKWENSVVSANNVQRFSFSHKCGIMAVEQDFSSGFCKDVTGIVGCINLFDF